MGFLRDHARNQPFVHAEFFNRSLKEVFVVSRNKRCKRIRLEILFRLDGDNIASSDFDHSACGREPRVVPRGLKTRDV